jgi:hypothetical protein
MVGMTRTRRRLFIVVGLLACMLVAGGIATWLLRSDTAITRENAEKIRPGMTLAEVEAILGGPPRDECIGSQRSCTWIGDIRGNHPAVWVGPDTAFRADFGDDERVVAMAVGDVQYDHEPPVDMLRRWLGF